MYWGQGKQRVFSQMVWVEILVLPLFSSVTLDTLCQSPHVSVRYSNKQRALGTLEKMHFYS